MQSGNGQRLIAWQLAEAIGHTPSFGDVAVFSAQAQEVSLILPFLEGEVHLKFRDARALMTSWDGDPNSFLTLEEATSRPSDLLKVENSRWLVTQFNQDLQSSLEFSDAPWIHFCIFSEERSIHIAARDYVDVAWNAQHQ